LIFRNVIYENLLKNLQLATDYTGISLRFLLG